MPEQSGTEVSQHPSTKPFSVTLLMVVVLTLTTLHWLRLVEVIRLWRFLSAPPTSFSTAQRVYFLLSGAVWGVAGLPLVWGLWRGKSWAPRLLRIAAPLYTIYYWADRLFLAIPETWQPRWPFALGMTVFLLGFTFWVFARAKARAFFSKRNQG